MEGEVESKAFIGRASHSPNGPPRNWRRATAQFWSKTGRHSHSDRAQASFALRAGEVRFIAVAAKPAAVTRERIDELLSITTAFWRERIWYCRYEGSYAEVVHRRALALKLVTYAPTGATVAALTTSLPEQLGGERNWDYRYCWIRDASLMLSAASRHGISGRRTRSLAHAGSGRDRIAQNEFVWRYLGEDGSKAARRRFWHAVSGWSMRCCLPTGRTMRRNYSKRCLHVPVMSAFTPSR